MTGETERYNCDIDISGKFLYTLEKTFPKQEKNTLFFKLPIIEEDMEIRLDNDTQVETVCLLACG